MLRFNTPKQQAGSRFVSAAPIPGPTTYPLDVKHRVVRFAAVGATCAAAQLALFWAVAEAGVHPSFANAFAFLVAAQMNFVLTRWVTWADRQTRRGLGLTWLHFMSAIGLTAALNFSVFEVARLFVAPLAAAAAGIGAGAVANFLISDRSVFAEAPGGASYVSSVIKEQ
jgi:putative flippase GtrA